MKLDRSLPAWVEKVTAEESDRYFLSRPLQSRVGAIASAQSRPLSGKAKLQRSLLIEAAVGEADVKVSATGACQLDKSHRNARIDVAQALCLACSAFVADMDAPTPEYEVILL